MPEKNFEHSVLKNGKLWIYAARKNRLVKVPISKDGVTEQHASVIDDQRIGSMRKIYVDDRGQHCFMLIGHQVFYTNWNSDIIK